MVTREALDGSPSEQLARWPSYGPGWDAAIAAGIDVALLEENLRLTPAERLAQLDEMTRLWESTRPDEDARDGAAEHAGAPARPR